ncbi:MAG TPA: nodulation protein NfeD [Candidatus Acidoferrales bacterium]|nr:nodulation protein NfeD [Candidatus Acidoferrales bacterium]
MVFQSSRRLLLLVAMVLLLGTARADAPIDPSASSGPSADAHVVVLRIDGEIEPILAQYITNGIQRAGREHASLVLITMNTPGGLDASMRRIVEAILGSSVPVAIYVAPAGARAASAGFFILESADIAAMAPGTNTGAASPVLELFGQTVQIDETMRKKVTNDASAFLRSYVIKRGRNTDLATAAVTDARAFSDKEALEGKLIDLVASSEQDLLAQLNGHAITRFDGSTEQLQLSHPVRQEVEMTAREKLLIHIVEPNVAFVLLIIGVLGLYVEFNHPGMFAPGVIGGIAILLALLAFQQLPVTLVGIALIVLALSLFVLEAKFPTHGILGIGGTVAMILGAIMLVQSPWTGMGVRLSTAIAVAIPFAVIATILMRAVLRSRSWKRATGREELLGEEGEVTEPVGVSPAIGMVRVHGELWRAKAVNGESIPKGARVRVRSIHGLTLDVEPAKQQSLTS